MDDKEFELRKMEFENSIKQRNFEIEYFWKRGWFFGALILALFTGYFQVKTSKPEFKIQDYSICIAFVAFLVSLSQSLMNRGSKYWQERWEYKTKNRESALGIDVTKTRNYNEYERYLIDACILAKKENDFLRSARFSVSKLTIIVWDIITIFCLLIWCSEIDFIPISKIDDSCTCYLLDYLFHSPIFWFHLVIITYLLVVRFNGKIYEDLLISPDNKDQGSDTTFNHSEVYVDNKKFDLLEKDNIK